MARRLPPPAGVAVAVLGTAVVVAAAILILGRSDETDEPNEPAPNVTTDPAAVDDLLDAWERSRTSTYLVESRFRRTVEGRSGLSSTIVIAQRPPDRLVSQSGSVEGRLGGREVSCTADAQGRDHCVSDRRAEPYAQEVAAGVKALAGYVRGDRPAYVVDRVGPCFRLRLALELPDAAREYGETTTLCFDAETGAPERRVVTRETSEDVTEAVRVVRAVPDRALRLPAPIGQTTAEPTG